MRATSAEITDIRLMSVVESPTTALTSDFLPTWRTCSRSPERLNCLTGQEPLEFSSMVIDFKPWHCWQEYRPARFIPQLLGSEGRYLIDLKSAVVICGTANRGAKGEGMGGSRRALYLGLLFTEQSSK